MTNSVPAGSLPDHGGAPPLPHRRPRVREVSSRFMSPSPSVSSAGDLHSLTMKSPKHSISNPAPSRPSPSQRRLLLSRQLPEPFSSSSSSQENIPETVRSMETPFQYAKPEPISTQSRQRVVKLFKENGYGDQMQQQMQMQIPKSSSVRTSKSSRPDTPSDRIVPSRFRLPHRQSSSQTTSSVTDAAKLLSNLSNSSSNCDSATPIESQSSQSSQSELESIQGGSCPNSPISAHRTYTCISMTDENTLSTRLLVRSSSCGSTSASTNCQSSSTPSLCTRSLNLPISSSHSSFKSIDRSVCKPSPVSLENRALPPQPGGTKPGVDSRKGKKHLSSQQEIHSLKMLYNHYLLWRYANAKAQASMHAQRTEVEKQFFSVGADITQLRDTVKKKRIELAILQRTKALSTILESQMPYLDEWPVLEEDYTNSLSGVITALTNSLLRLPISGNVQVNMKEAAEALDSAVKTADMIVHQMQSFLPKAEEMDNLISELASVIDVEKALVEECGHLLGKTHTLQVEDCSLRGHLMQLSIKKQ